MDKIVFFNIACMERYQGIAEDKAMHGGRYVEERGYGAEIFNFQPFEDKMYGFVEAGWNPLKCINIARLGAPGSAPAISGILVIWVAKQSYGKKTLVVGWYKDATVYRERQKPPVGSNRKEPSGGDAPYFAEADKENCLLIPPKMRDFEILRASGRKGAGGVGQSNIWYAEDNYGAQIKPKVLEYITKWERQRQLAVRPE